MNRVGPTSGGGSAPGAPGIAPTWSSSAKDAIGTSHFASRVWFTVGRGIVNEVYWPRVDRPQVRDLGFIVADGAGFWSEVKRRDVESEVSFVRPGVPAVVVIHRHARYVLRLRICADDHADVIRIETRLEDTRDPADSTRGTTPLRLYALLAPHLGLSGWHNRAWTGAYKGRPMLYAASGSSSLALASDPPPTRQSVGFVGASDGWQDFATNGRMTWTYGSADAGNVAGMVEIDAGDVPAQIALGFGDHPEAAALQVSAALIGHFEVAWDEYAANWQRFLHTCTPPAPELGDDLAALYLDSAAVLRTHQDRAAPGATTASLSVPWGNARNDLGGYHLVWSRDLVETAGALIALGARASAQRTLAYLVATQEPDGHWPQNQWVDGVAYWNGIQLDEAAYPILLAGALREAGAVHMHGQHAATADFEHLVDEDALGRMSRAGGRVHGADRTRDPAGPLGGERGADAVHAGAGHRRPGGRGRPSARAVSGLLPGARRRLERIDRGLDVRDRIRGWHANMGSTVTTCASPRHRCWLGRPSPRGCRCAIGLPRTRPSRPMRWSARTSSRSSASACADPIDPASSHR